MPAIAAYSAICTVVGCLTIKRLCMRRWGVTIIRTGRHRTALNHTGLAPGPYQSRNDNFSSTRYE